MTQPAHPSDATTQARLVERLRQLHRESFLIWALSVAQAVIDELYDGDFGRYHDKNRYKDDPFDALVADWAGELADLGLSAAALRQYITAWNVHRCLPPDVRNALTIRHLVKLASLAAPSDRARIARLSADEDWTARQMDDAVAAELAATLGVDPRQGRPRLPAEVKAVHAVRRRLDDFDALREQTGPLHALPLGSRIVLRQQLEAVRQKCAELLAELGA